MTPEMQQAIYLLQLPLMELTSAIEQEVEGNPVLEYLQEEEGEEREEEELPPEKEMVFDEKQFEILRRLDEEFSEALSEGGVSRKRTREEDRYQAFVESNIEEPVSLSFHLMIQAREAFTDKEDLEIAEILIGHLDEQGFLKANLQEIATLFSKKIERIRKVLKVLKTFDPVGVGSENVKEVLLIQLLEKGKKDSLPYQIIDRHYNALIHNRLPEIAKKCKTSLEKLREVIQEEISPLELHPAAPFSTSSAPTLIPDVRLTLEGEKFVAEVNEDPLRPLKLNRKYLRMIDDPEVPKETKEFIKGKILSAKWLMRNVHERGSTLVKIANFLGEHQRRFFESPEGTLNPLILRQVAEEIGLHESTVARAISGKYLESPRGIFPFRYFFSGSYTDEKGHDLSSKTVRDLVEEIIHGEDKKKPLSDEAISKKIQEKGVVCARRTVTKYRGELNIGNTQERRKF